MRLTYRQLRMYLNELSEEQLDCDVTFEDYYAECTPAGFEIAGGGHDCLDEGHPIILAVSKNDDSRFTDEDVAEDIVCRRECGDFV